jgi:hypothetical protein
MPTFIKDVVFNEVNNVFNGSGVFQYALTAQHILRSERTFPLTVTRKIPPDPFIGGTSRSTSSVLQYASTCTAGYRQSASDFRIRTGLPGSQWWSTSNGKDPTLPLANYEPMFNTIRSGLRRDAVNLAMAVAEYRKTAALFGSLARGVSSRGRSLAAALKQRSGVSKTWLGFQYGVKPAVNDILGSIDELKNACAQPVFLHGVESRKEREMLQSVVRHSSTYHAFDGHLESHLQRRLRVRWRAEYNPNAVFNVLVAHGFTNPFALAYELIPYSFVLDWWINVGEVLASLDNLLLFDKLAVITSDSTTRARYINSPGYIDSSGKNFVRPHSWTRITRTDSRASPRYISMINTLQYKPSVSLTHILNGLALLRVARKRF